MDGLGTLEGAMQSPDSLGNTSEIEANWAMKAVEHSELHFSLISSVPPRLLKLTQMDDEIFRHFRQVFPDLQLGKLDDDVLKNPAAKEQWRQFCESYRGRVADYNFGTLLRLDASQDYSDQNTTIALQVQVLAIEIARNREGVNDVIHELYGKKE